MVEPHEIQEQESGGIILPDSAKKKPILGTVKAIGTGRYDDNGNLIPMSVKVGDVVLIPKYTGIETGIDDCSYLFFDGEAILARVEEEKT